MTGIIKTDQLQGAQSSTITVPSGNNLTVSGAFTSQGIDDNANAVAITIDTSENVGIGTSSPTGKLTVDGGSIHLGNNGEGVIFGSDTNTNNAIFGNASSNFVAMMTSGSERMRINSSGQVGIGVSAAATVFHVETSTDGTGTSGDELYIAKFYNREATNDRSYGIDIHAGSTATDQSLRVKDHDGTNEHFLIKGNGEVNISRDNIVFKTAGKGIYLGATSANAAKLLDDYEEGTWTPTLLGSSSNPTVSYNQTSASYIKIGQSVHLYGRILATSVSGGSGTALIGGLPFATSGSSRNAGTIGYISNVSLGTGYTQFGLNPDAGTSTMRLVQSGSGIGANVISVGVIANNFDLTFSHSYTV